MSDETMLRLTLPPGAAPTRLDKLLCERLPGCTRRRARELIAGGHVRVDGRRARKGVEVRPGSLVQVDPIEGSSVALPPADRGDVRVIYEDSAVIAVDKPAGMPSHPRRAGDLGTAANFLVARYPELAAVGRPLEAGLVHRLDNDTSGVLLAARTPAAHDDLRRQFSRGEVVKKYLALVRGEVVTAATIDAPIEHAPGSRRRMRIAAPGTGRGAITRYVPLCQAGGNTWIEVEMRTGVRHQIRVHLAAAGHPLVGDRLYDRQTDASGAGYQLRAISITFRHPTTKEQMTLRESVA